MEGRKSKRKKKRGPRAVLQPGPPTTETAAAAASTDPMAMDDDDGGKPREIVLASPGNELSSGDSEDDTGAQDAQDRITEGPLTARKLGNYKP
eukprot:814519-Amphidinium_carterae.1